MTHALVFGQHALVLGQFVAGGYSLLSILVFIIIACAAVGIAYAITNAMGVAIPPIVRTVVGIVCLAFLGVAALVFLFRMAATL